MKRHTLSLEDGRLTMRRKVSKAGFIFGVPMFVGGGAILLIGGMTFLGAITSGSLPPAFVGVLGLALGSVFLALGAICLFARSGTQFDVRDQFVTQWIKVFLYARITKTPLAGFDRVVVDEHLWQGRPRYSLLLAGSTRLKILTTRRGNDVVELAERIATLLSIPISNQSGLQTAQIS